MPLPDGSKRREREKGGSRDDLRTQGQNKEVPSGGGQLITNLLGDEARYSM